MRDKLGANTEVEIFDSGLVILREESFQKIKEITLFKEDALRLARRILKELE